VTRAALVLLVVALIAMSLWGMRRGWRNRAGRQHQLVEPLDAPPPDSVLSAPVAGLFVGTATQGDWLDRIVVYDLGVRSACEISWSHAGIWFDRVGARGLFVPAADVTTVRTDRGVAGTVRARDSVIVVTWGLGGVMLDTGFRAADSAGHGTVLDGLVTTFSAGVQ
jgi:hypothetical protein